MTHRPLQTTPLILLLVSAALAGEPVPPAALPAPGDTGYTLSALQGNRIEQIPLKFLGTYKNFVGPGYDLHLVQLEGPVAERVGVAAGMSGSPVYVNERLIGALSYRMGSLPKDAVAGVTPIEDMRRADPARTAGPSRSNGAMTPIGTPILVGGMPAEVREWLSASLEPSGFVLVGGGGARGDRVPSAGLEPGSPLGVELVRGDLSIAATGTVTWVDESGVYAFGHPFLGSGRAEMPMVSAEVIHTLADLAGSVKLANTGEEIGAIVEDRLTAVVGRPGRRAHMIPVGLRMRGAGYGEQNFRFELVENSRLTPLLAGAVVANFLVVNTGYDQRATMLVSGRMKLNGLPDLPLEMAFSGAGGADPSLSVAVALRDTLDSLLSNPFAEPRIESLELEVRVRPEEVRYFLESLQYDRGPIRPGQSLTVQCVLRRYRGGTVTRDLSFTVPDGLAETRTLALAVGPPGQVDRALGQPIARRLRSAEDLASVVRAFGERGSAHRLRGVLYQSSPSVFVSGEHYEDLPPTAERLLAARARSNRAARTRVSRLVTSEVELDGPLEGGLVVRLQLDGAAARTEGGR